MTNRWEEVEPHPPDEREGLPKPVPRSTTGMGWFCG
jgi:hypothetical protein